MILDDGGIGCQADFDDMEGDCTPLYSDSDNQYALSNNDFYKKRAVVKVFGSKTSFDIAK